MPRIRRSDCAGQRQQAAKLPADGVAVAHQEEQREQHRKQGPQRREKIGDDGAGARREEREEAAHAVPQQLGRILGQREGAPGPRRFPDSLDAVGRHHRRLLQVVGNLCGLTREGGDQHDGRQNDQQPCHQRQQQRRAVPANLSRQLRLCAVKEHREYRSPGQRHQERPEHQVAEVNRDEHEHVERRPPQTIPVGIGHRR